MWDKTEREKRGVFAAKAVTCHGSNRFIQRNRGFRTARKTGKKNWLTWAYLLTDYSSDCTVN